MLENSQSAKVSTKIGIYYTLKATLHVKKVIDINNCTIVVAFLKRWSVGYKANKNILDRGHVDKFTKIKCFYSFEEI